MSKLFDELSKEIPIETTFEVFLMFEDEKNWNNGVWSGDKKALQEKVDFLTKHVKEWVQNGMPEKKKVS